MVNWLQVNGKALIQKFYSSNYWMIYFFSQLVVTFIVAIYVMFDLKENIHSPVVIIFEVVITAAILFDVFIRYYLLGNKAFKELMFVIDLTLLLCFSVVLLWMMINYSKEDEEIDVLLLVVRIIFQLVRVPLFVMKVKKKFKEIKAIEEIDVRMDEDSDALSSRRERDRHVELFSTSQTRQRRSESPVKTTVSTDEAEEDDDQQKIDMLKKQADLMI